MVTHAPHAKERGFYVKVGDKTYHKGSGLLHGLFGKNSIIKYIILNYFKGNVQRLLF